MIHKVAYISDGLFQVGDNQIPVDEQSLIHLASSSIGFSESEAQAWIDKVKLSKQGQLDDKIADTGVIVDMYEVEYPTPVDPLKQTEELASHLDEKRDFIMQHVFPQTETTDVIVGLRQDILKNKSQETPVSKESSKKGWREVLKA